MRVSKGLGDAGCHRPWQGGWSTGQVQGASSQGRDGKLGLQGQSKARLKGVAMRPIRRESHFQLTQKEDFSISQWCPTMEWVAWR